MRARTTGPCGDLEATVSVSTAIAMGSHGQDSATPRPPGVLVLVDGLRVHVLTEDGELIREPTLDPTRD